MSLPGSVPWSSWPVAAAALVFKKSESETLVDLKLAELNVAEANWSVNGFQS